MFPLSSSDYPEARGPTLDETRESGNGHTYIDFRSDQPLTQHHTTYFRTYGFFQRVYHPLHMMLIRRRLSRHVAEGLSATREDIQNRFVRLDVLDLGALDETKTQLLLSWAFDIDLRQSDWEAIFYHLAGPSASLAKREAILAWTDSLLRDHSREATSVSARFRSTVKPITDFGNYFARTNFVIDHQGPFIAFWRVVKTIVALYIFLSVPYQVRAIDLSRYLCDVVADRLWRRMGGD